ncbi:MAG TPA: hypothetical protein VH475_24890 [Tepidisphaeraceae bacterium]|jgi:hypothetical protein
MAKDKSDWDLTSDEDRDRIGGGPGASDANSGAGNATGVPDAETGMAADDAVTDRGDIEEDRKRLFPESPETEPHPSQLHDRPEDEEPTRPE